MSWNKITSKIKSFLNYFRNTKCDIQTMEEKEEEIINLIELKDNCLFKINNFLLKNPSELIKNIIINQDVNIYTIELSIEINNADINWKDIKSLTNTIELYINSFAKINKCTVIDIIFEIETDKTCKTLTLDCLF